MGVSKFKYIKDEYSKLNEKLIGPTKVGYFGCANLDVVNKLFRRIRLSNYKNFIDLGSGDGRVTLLASAFTKAKGIEGDKDIIKISRSMLRKVNKTIEEKFNKRSKLKAEFLKKDFLQHDLSKFDVIFINPDDHFYELEKKLRQEMKKKAKLIVYGKLYKPLNLELKKEYIIDQEKISVYEN